MHQIGEPTDTAAVYGSLGIVALSNRYIIGGQIYDPLSPNGTRTKLYKIDKGFNKLDSNNFYSLFFLQSGYAFNNHIVANTDRLASPCVLSANMQQLDIDTNLHIINCKVMDTLLLYQCHNSGTTFNNIIGLNDWGKSVALSSTKTLLMGVSSVGCRFTVPYWYDVVVNAIVDQNIQMIKTNVFANSFINTNYPGFWNSPYSVKLPYIVTVSAIGFTNVPSWPPPFYPYYFQQKSKMLINKMDTMGNVIWEKQYGGEMNYFGRGIAFTADGGCIVAGTRYDSTTMYAANISENFLLKLDSSGNFIGVGLSENAVPATIKCYPNPAHDRLYFDIPFETEIEIDLFNNLGILVRHEKNYTTLNPIDVGDLNEQLYYYRVRTKLNNYCGKFLKE
jgi:hypothetical protein